MGFVFRAVNLAGSTLIFTQDQKPQTGELFRSGAFFCSVETFLKTNNSRYSLEPIDLSSLSTISLKGRGGKVNTSLFGKPLKGLPGIGGFLEALPHILAANGLREVVHAIESARSANKAILWGMGGHVIKTGMAPVLAELMENGFATGFAMNGSASIHDFEIALVGYTSEDVEAVLPDGRFGSAEETGREMNDALGLGRAEGLGMGESLGRKLDSIADPAFAQSSLLVRAYRSNVPVTVHVAVGTDTPHTHPAADGANIGATTHHDFRLFSSLVTELNNGGVYINLGSAVVMPEVFLKALSAVRNLGYVVNEFTTVNLDFLQHYRPKFNVLERPHAGGAGGRGYGLTGHHEIMLPLLAALLLNPVNE